MNKLSIICKNMSFTSYYEDNEAGLFSVRKTC